MNKRKAPRQYASNDAAIKLFRFFRRAARKFCRRCRFTQDDLAQEMALGVLQCQGEHSMAYYKACAVWQALDFLRRLRLEKSHICPITREHRETLAAPEPEAEAEKRIERFVTVLDPGLGLGA